MKVFMTLFLLILFLGCFKVRPKIDPKALKLNNDAVAIIASTDDSSQLEHARILLDQAIKIDTNYLIAYNSKANVLTTLKRYKPALNAFKKFYSMLNNKNSVEYLLGTAYEKAGDTTSAKKHYKVALVYLKKVLDTMNEKNSQYEFTLENFSKTLILLNRKPEADSILTTGAKNLEYFDKVGRAIVIKESRKEILYPELSKGAGIDIDDLKKMNFKD